MMSLYAVFTKSILVYCILLVLDQVFLEVETTSKSNNGRRSNVIFSGAMAQESCEVGADGVSTCSNAGNNAAENVANVQIPMHKYDAIVGEVTSVDSKLPKGANSEGKPLEVKLGECKDRHEMCKSNSRNGECERNPGWMIVNCPQSCNRCHLLDPKVRCNRDHLNISTSPVYTPGSIDNMFGSIERKFKDKYEVNVVSRSPWVITFDNFLTDKEIKALIKTVDGSWERSTDTGQVNEYGETGRVLSKSRTSSNAWCRSACESHPNVKSVMTKIEEITGIPRENSESFQILRYEVGQYYNTHHDMAPHQNKLACGPRILTFFLYLSDVDEGGETNFPGLNIDVKPKKGRALLWPSVMDRNLEEQDPRTNHGAKPVIKGLKYAANSWIHLYDFQKANKWGCTGTFDTI